MSKVNEDILKHCLSLSPDTTIMNDITALDMVNAIKDDFFYCPKCGVEPWVNIDCDLCLMMHYLCNRDF